ncbi:MAG: elongation factor P [Patescibacteria group bacterium]|mgnify:FL=1
MAILEYNQITGGKIIVYEGEPYEVLESHVFRKQQRKPVNQVKLKNIISGRVTEYSFHQSEKSEEVELDSRTVKYLYNNKGEFWFSEENDPSKRFSIPEESVGVRGQFMKPNMLVEIMNFQEKLVGIKMPIKIDLKVVEAPPGIKGDTRQGGSKQVVLETKAVINAPLFINEGDMVIVNTESGEYVGRAEKN